MNESWVLCVISGGIAGLLAYVLGYRSGYWLGRKDAHRASIGASIRASMARIEEQRAEYKARKEREEQAWIKEQAEFQADYDQFVKDQRAETNGR